MTRIGRRQLLAAAVAALPGTASAMGRVPITGKLAFRLPWSTARIDPHDLFDPLAAILGGAIAEPVYARSADGTVFPTLADGMPKVEDDQTVVRVRAGLLSAKGKPLGGRDLAWSIARARKLGAIGLFANITPWVRSDKEDVRVVRFGTVDPTQLAIILSSPLCALLPVGFSSTEPDGTGAFLAKPSAKAIELTRNINAARGPSQLEAITVRAAADLADSLRTFESGQDDIGWQGLGFYGERPSSHKFDYQDTGWVVLCTGKSAGSFHEPGMAQKLANEVPVERMHVGLRGRGGTSAGTPWTGGAAKLIYDNSAPQLKEIADAVAAKLSQPGHEVTASGVSRANLRRARTSESFALALDVVRDLGMLPASTSIALATAHSPERGTEIGKHPSTAKSAPAHSLTAKLHVGVLGGLSIQGGVIDEVVLAPHRSARGVDWGNTYRS